MSTTLHIGTRESLLARLQTDIVLQALTKNFPNHLFEIVAVTTHGDKLLNKPIADLGSRGVFVKELEEALLNHKVDLVVHSLKDLPTELPSGLALAAVLDRQDVRDVLVSHNKISFASLPAGSRVATSSRRRAAQLKAIRNDLDFIDIRGNIQTRLRKHDEGACEAMVLAAAGLIRLGLTERITEYFDPQQSTPAAGQGVLGVECRSDDKLILSMLATIDNHSVRAAIEAERSFLDELGGGCSVPVGALAKLNSEGLLHLSGCVAALDGSKIFRASLAAPPAAADQLGKQLAQQLLTTEARQILETLKPMTSNMVSPP